MKAVLFLITACSICFGQISSGTFYGEVRDQSGAVVSGVRVSVQETGTGFSRNTVTDGSGSYRVPDLAPGIYSLRAGRTGFRTFVTSAVTLEINQQARFDFTLLLGSP